MFERNMLIAEIVIAFIVVGFISCTVIQHTPDQVTPVPTSTSTSIAVTEGWKQEWADLVASTLSPKQLEANPGTLCPKWRPEISVNFWQALMKATAYYESSWNPNNSYTENFKDDKGNPQVSRGLFQISVSDTAKKTPVCSTLTVKNIYEPRTNILCSMEIMNWLLGSRPTMQESLARYWSTIRSGKVLTMMRKDIPECF